MHVKPVQTKVISQAEQKKRYQAPVLVIYGMVAELTQSGTASGKEGSGTGNSVRKP